MVIGKGTKAIHAWRDIDLSSIKPITMPLYSSIPYEFPTEYRVYGKVLKYSREENPTVYAFEYTLAQLEKCRYGLAFSSGMSSISTLFTLASLKGKVLVICKEDYGSTLTLARKLKSIGLRVNETLPNEEDIVNHIENEGIVFLESITNPLLKVFDLEVIGKACKESNALMVVDNTFASPVLLNPVDYGSDIVIYSITKYIGGYNDVLGGAILLNDELLLNELLELRKLLGTIMSPYSAYLALRGLKTLKARVLKHSENAKIIAEFLEDHPKVEEVYYPGLKSNPRYEIACKLLKGGFGGVISFTIKGTTNDAINLLRRFKIIKPSPSFGGTESLIIHPLSSSHKDLSEEDRRILGIKGNLLRLSVGLEDVEDIMEDLNSALSTL